MTTTKTHFHFPLYLGFTTLLQKKKFYSHLYKIKPTLAFDYNIIIYTVWFNIKYSLPFPLNIIHSSPYSIIYLVVCTLYCIVYIQFHYNDDVMLSDFSFFFFFILHSSHHALPIFIYQSLVNELFFPLYKGIYSIYCPR